MVVGGVEGVSLPGHGNFIRINALDPVKIRPFDRERKGTLIGEGAGIMVLETLESAVSRGVSILGEVKGVGISCDGYHESAPDPTCCQIINALHRAVEDASLSLNSIECISAHGTGTIPNDKFETKAIKEFFGETARDISITANKSMLGHGIGSACAASVIAAVLMIKNNLVVPTINYENPDPECDLDYTVNKARKRELNNVMVNSYGFGGNNSSVIISRFNS
jgi:3-oxoacyl-[acyl-carrier-protein] synthase II